LAALEAAARKIHYRVQSPTRDELQIQLKPSKWLLGLSFPDITVTFTGSADRSAAVIVAPCGPQKFRPAASWQSRNVA
jgi:hypothetical protein